MYYQDSEQITLSLIAATGHGWQIHPMGSYLLRQKFAHIIVSISYTWRHELDG